MRRRTPVLIFLLVLAAVPSTAERYQVRRVAVGASPEAILSVPGGAVVAVTGIGEHAVVLVGGSPLRELDRVELGGEPMALAYDPFGGRVFVTFPGGGVMAPHELGGIVVLRLDGDQLDFDQEAPLDAWGPYTSIYDPATDALYVADIIFRDQHGANPPDSIQRVPATNLQATQQLEAEEVWNMRLDPRTGKLYIPSLTDGILSVLDTRTGDVVLHPRPWTLYDLELCDELDRLYLISGLGRLEALDLASGDWLDPVATAMLPWDVAVQNERVYLGFRTSTGIAVHDAWTLEPLGDVDFPWQTEYLAAAPERERLFASGRISGMLAVLDTESDTLIDNLSVGANPVASSYDSTSRTLWVSLNGEGAVAAVTPQTSPGGTTVTALPDWLPANGLATSLVTVVPRDENNELMGSGHSVVIHTTAGRLLGEVNDHGDGTYTQELESTKRSETAIASAEVNGTLMGTRPHVVFGLIGFPEVRTSEPDWGHTVGNTLVTIEGTNLGLGNVPASAGGSTTVHFGEAQAALLEVAADEILCLTPPHDPGTVDITVTHTYAAAPPRSGSLRGGFTYWANEASSLVAWRRAPDQVALAWKGPQGAEARLEVSSSRDFSSGVQSMTLAASSLVGPPESQPTDRITYYRVRFD